VCRSGPGSCATGRKSRLLTSLNFRHRQVGVVRLGYYAELRRDRFANRIPGGGLTLTTAVYF
jgi:hypothetical protein